MQIAKNVYLVGSDQFGISHPLDCNCYLLDGGSELALIDTGLGLGVDDICAEIHKHGFDKSRLKHVLITHSHVGHWGGAVEIRHRTGCSVLIHSTGAPKTADISTDQGIQLNRRHGRYPANFAPRPCTVDGTFEDGQRIRTGRLSVDVIETRGHTKDSVCFLLEQGDKRALFTGDTVFHGGRIGLLNLDGCSLDDYRRDIHKLANLGIDMLFPGHGVFMLRRGQRHINRAIQKLSDFVLPDTFFETNELMWDRDYLRMMTA